MSADGVDQFLFMAVVDFFAQISDIHIDDIGAAREVVIPHMLFQFIPAQNQSGILHHITQQGIFFGRKLNFLIAPEDAAGV